MTHVEIRGITKRYPGITANDNISLSFEEGKIHAILGENGAGKSTLMSILSGLTHQDAGEILLEHKSVHFSSPADAIAQGIGMVYQHFMLVDAFTVTENFKIGIRSSRKLKSEIAELSKRYGLRVKPDTLIAQLSVGEKQRVEILRMLHRGAQVLILDEPTSVLTPQETDQLGATLRQLANEGKTIIFITHKLAEVVKFADRVTVLREGKIASTLEKVEISLEKLATLMMGNDNIQLQATSFLPRGKEVLCLESFSLHEGEILGVAGIAGNGQRELAEQIAFQGKNGDIRYIPEDRTGIGLAPNLSVEQNLIMRQYRTWGPLLRQKHLRQIAIKLISSFIIKAKPNTPLEHLSGGNRQKVLVARETSEEPKVLVAANPTQGLDIATTTMVRKKLVELRNSKVAILLISEDLDELLELSDRIAVLHNGQIMGIVNPKTVHRESIGLLMTGIKQEE